MPGRPHRAKLTAGIVEVAYLHTPFTTDAHNLAFNPQPRPPSDGIHNGARRNRQLTMGLAVHITLVDAQGQAVGTHKQEWYWHPWLYHYGRNWTVAGDGLYTMRVRSEPLTFAVMTRSTANASPIRWGPRFKK